MREAFVGFVAALVWTAAVAPAGGVGGSPLALVATFGCASVALVPAVFALRHGRPDDPASRAMLHGALLAAFPLAAFGALLSAKTHHRALGAVTYAVVAAVVIAGCVLFGRRIARWGRAAAVALAGAAYLSVVGVGLWLAVATPTLRGVVVESAVGAVLLFVAAGAPLDRLPGWTRHAAAAGAVAATTGVVLFALNQELRRHLAEAAPVATFVVRVLGGA